MHSELRVRRNAAFAPGGCAKLLRRANETERSPADFRVSETPSFPTHEFAEKKS